MRPSSRYHSGKGERYRPPEAPDVPTAAGVVDPVGQLWRSDPTTRSPVPRRLVGGIVAERPDTSERGWGLPPPTRPRIGLRRSGTARTCEAPWCTFSRLPIRRRDFSPGQTLASCVIQLARLLSEPLEQLPNGNAVDREARIAGAPLGPHPLPAT